MVLDTQVGRILDTGKTYQDAVLPMLAGFSVLSALGTLLLMRPLGARARVNAEVAAMKACGGDRNGEGTGGVGAEEDSGLALGPLGGGGAASGIPPVATA